MNDIGQLEADMASFKVKFNGFLLESKRARSDAKTRFDRELETLKAESEVLQSELEAVNELQAQEQSAFESEGAELVKNEAQLSAKQDQLRQLQLSCDEMKLEINTLRRKIDSQTLNLTRQRDSLLNQAQLDGPEVDFWETTLGLTVEGIAVDVVRFNFHTFDEGEQPFVVLDVSQTDYAVNEIVPLIDYEDVLDELNGGGSLGTFLKQLRQRFGL